MKKVLCIALIAIIAAATFAAQGEDGLFKTRYFTLELPQDWETDFENLSHEKDSWELGYAFPPGNGTMCIYAELSYYESWSDFSLWKADPTEMKEYEKSLLDEFADNAPKLTETIYVGRIPFFVLKLEDEDSVYYWAETMTNGYAVGLECYALKKGLKEYRDVSPDEYALFIKILKSFKPVL